VELVRLDSPSALGSGPSALTLGNFDGVHRGHQALVAETVSWARTIPGAAAVVLTFDPHPARILNPSQRKSALMTLDQKAEVIASLGIDRLAVLPFTEAIARMSAEEFARAVLRDSLGAARVVVGQDFRFGQGRAGDVAALTDLGGSLGFQVRGIPPVLEDGAPISSSRIRDTLASGDVAKARGLLGRPYYVDGTVVRGEGRGKSLGIATANLAVRNETLPQLGVYACRVRLGGGQDAWPAVANLGQRPTFGGGEAVLEAHLLDFEGDLYGREARLEFVERLRAERGFPGRVALLEQIRSDIEGARHVLEKP
jgi:riboflavin kinase / FMN adenylyltransferase